MNKLINFPKIRIKEYPKGFSVEIQKIAWYGRKYWTHAIGVSGMSDEPWFYPSYELALSQFHEHFKNSLTL